MAVPHLIPGERVENWELLFRAATGPLVAQGENGLKLAMGMLPAYICRSVEEREVVRVVVQASTTLDEAFKTEGAAGSPY